MLCMYQLLMTFLRRPCHLRQQMCMWLLTICSSDLTSPFACFKESFKSFANWFGPSTPIKSACFVDSERRIVHILEDPHVDAPTLQDLSVTSLASSILPHRNRRLTWPSASASLSTPADSARLYSPRRAFADSWNVLSMSSLGIAFAVSGWESNFSNWLTKNCA